MRLQQPYITLGHTQPLFLVNVPVNVLVSCSNEQQAERPLADMAEPGNPSFRFGSLARSPHALQHAILLIGSKFFHRPVINGLLKVGSEVLVAPATPIRKVATVPAGRKNFTSRLPAGRACLLRLVNRPSIHKMLKSHERGSNGLTCA